MFPQKSNIRASQHLSSLSLPSLFNMHQRLFHSLQARSVIIYSPWPLTISISVWSTPLSLPGTGESQSGASYCCLILNSLRGESALRSPSLDAEEGVCGDWHTETTDCEEVVFSPHGVTYTHTRGTVHGHYLQAFFHGGPSASAQT